MVAPLRSLTDLRLDDLRTMKVVPSYQLIAGNSMPSWTSRWNVIVVMRDSTSTSPLCRAAKRWAAVSGVNRTSFASPRTAAAIARHTSTSRPRHSPCASGAENPATPVVTPHWTNFFRRTASTVGVALGPRACGWPVGTGAASSVAVLEHAEMRTARPTDSKPRDGNPVAFRTVPYPQLQTTVLGASWISVVASDAAPTRSLGNAALLPSRLWAGERSCSVHRDVVEGRERVDRVDADRAAWDRRVVHGRPFPAVDPPA